MRFLIAISLILFTLNHNVKAEIHREIVEYKQGDTVLEGYLAYDESLQGERPGILVVHEWNGLGSYVKGRADQLAHLGYVAFAVDIYGKGVRPQNPEESGKQAALYRNDRKLMRERAIAGLEELKKNKFVNRSRIAAIGYCFGGGVALELARSGADLAGVVSFHGSLDTPNPDDARNIKARILVCHGGNDLGVTWDAVTAFKDEMTKAGVNWQINVYSDAVHGFTNPDNGTDPSKGVAYSEQADKRSWQAMKDFFDEIFK